ncbi:MAG: hypothetical protein ACREQY_06425 [Candidatus Binatia bacterium]
MELSDIARIVFVAVAAAAVWFGVREPLPRVSVIGIAATLIGGFRPKSVRDGGVRDGRLRALPTLLIPATRSQLTPGREV